MTRKRTAEAVLEPPGEADSVFAWLAPDQLRPAADNPRRTIDMVELEELTASVRSLGILEPLLVRPGAETDTYLVVAGHRRLAAALAAGLPAVPCVIRAMTDAQRIEAALVENLQRVGLSTLEEAEAYQSLLTLTGASQHQLASRIGRSQGHISKRVGLLRLAAVARDALDSGGITVNDAEALSHVPADKVEALFASTKKPDGWRIAEVLREHTNAQAREATRKELAKAGVKILDEAPAQMWRYGLDNVGLSEEEHAGEPCHVAVIHRNGLAGLLCAEPDRHEPDGDSALKVRSDDEDLDIGDEPVDDADLSDEERDEREREATHRAAEAVSRAEVEERVAVRMAAIEQRRAFAGDVVRAIDADGALELVALMLGGLAYVESPLWSTLAMTLLDIAVDVESSPHDQLIEHMSKGGRVRARVLAAVAVAEIEGAVTPHRVAMEREGVRGIEAEDIELLRSYLTVLSARGYQFSEHDRELLGVLRSAAPDPAAEGADEGLAWYTGHPDDLDEDPPRWITDQDEFESLRDLYPDRLVDLDGEPLVVTGDGTGEALPELPEDAYAEDAEGFADIRPEVTIKGAGKRWDVKCSACGNVGHNTTEALAQQRREMHLAEQHAAEPVGAAS